LWSRVAHGELRIATCRVVGPCCCGAIGALLPVVEKLVEESRGTEASDEKFFDGKTPVAAETTTTATSTTRAWMIKKRKSRA
jgi:hypothetical protein